MGPFIVEVTPSNFESHGFSVTKVSEANEVILEIEAPQQTPGCNVWRAISANIDIEGQQNSVVSTFLNPEQRSITVAFVPEDKNELWLGVEYECVHGVKRYQFSERDW